MKVTKKAALLLPILYLDKKMQKASPLFKIEEKERNLIFFIFLGASKGVKFQQIQDSYCLLTGIGKHTVRELLYSLIDRGLVVQVKKGRSIDYQLANKTLLDCVKLMQAIERKINILSSLCK